MATTDTSHDRHSVASGLHNNDQSDLKGSRFSVASVASSIPALTTISSVDADLATLVIDRAQPPILEELRHSASAPSTSLAKTSRDEPRNSTQEVLGALHESSPSSTPGDTSDSKPPEPSIPPPPVGAMRRERPRRLRERPPVFEEDGGIRLAGGPLDEPPQEFLPPPYRRY